MTNRLTTFSRLMEQALTRFVTDFHHYVFTQKKFHTYFFTKKFSLFHHWAGLAAILCLETFDCIFVILKLPLAKYLTTLGQLFTSFWSFFSWLKIFHSNVFLMFLPPTFNYFEIKISLSNFFLIFLLTMLHYSGKKNHFPNVFFGDF